MRETGLHSVGRSALKAARKLRARRHVTRTVWFGLGMMGLIGWSVGILTLLGVALGLWLDRIQAAAPGHWRCWSPACGRVFQRVVLGVRKTRRCGKSRRMASTSLASLAGGRGGSSARRGVLGGLWWTVKGVSSRRPALWFFGSLLVRRDRPGGIVCGLRRSVGAAAGVSARIRRRARHRDAADRPPRTANPPAKEAGLHLSRTRSFSGNTAFSNSNATIVFTWGLMLVLAVGSKLITRRLSIGLQRSRWQNLLEIVVTGIEKQIEEVGLSHPRKYLGFLGTLFLFVAAASLCTVIPGYEPPTGSLSTTAALALCVFVAVPFFGIEEQGVGSYLKSYVKPTFIMLPFNIISELSRTLALAVRLFGNMMSGAMIIGILLTITPFIFPIVMTALGLLTGMVQAYIFSILAAVYIAAAALGKPPGRADLNRVQKLSSRARSATSGSGTNNCWNTWMEGSRDELLPSRETPNGAVSAGYARRFSAQTTELFRRRVLSSASPRHMRPARISWSQVWPGWSPVRCRWRLVNTFRSAPRRIPSEPISPSNEENSRQIHQGSLLELTRIYETRGLDPSLAKQVAEQLTAHDALAAHARDELGMSTLREPDRYRRRSHRQARSRLAQPCPCLP